ncbi:MAG: MaoC family dehydratase [Pseudomonadota bacterium]
MANPVYLEDLSVGQTFVSSTAEITAADIKAFAQQYDPQPFHLDDAAADASPVFRGLAASGWHTAAVTMRLLVTGGPAFAWGVVGAGSEVNWPRPTRPGDRLTVHGQIAGVTPSRSKPDRGIVEVRSETRNQRGEIVQNLTARLLVPRRPAT